MAERSRRIRRQISDVVEDSSETSDAESDDFDPRKSDASRRAGRNEPVASGTSRSRRGMANPNWPLSQQKYNTSGLDDKKQSIKLTMKVAPSKLREVMRANEVESLQDTLGGGKVIDGPRATRRATQARTSGGRQGRRLRYHEYAESDIEVEEETVPEETTLNDFDEIGAEAEGGTEDEEDEDEEEEEEDDDDEEEDGDEGDEDDEEEEEDDEEDGGEDAEEDEDIEMEDAPPPMKKSLSQPKPPKITLKAPGRGDYRHPTKPKLIVTPANVGPVKFVEDQEMEDDPDDEEVEESSELSDNDRNGDNTNLNDEDMDGDEGNGEEDEDDEGDEDEDELDDDEEDELGDSGDETPASGQATPDPSRMTQRQRGRPGETLMALDMAPQQRKFFTDAEKAMKKDEHARKRKELTKRKTQEEKTAALNRLLKPQVSKSRGAAPKADTLAAQIQAAVEEEELDVRADPLYTRWISTKEGVRLGVPDEWLGKNVGKYFGPPLPPSNRSLIQEVE